MGNIMRTHLLILSLLPSICIARTYTWTDPVSGAFFKYEVSFGEVRIVGGGRFWANNGRAVIPSTLEGCPVTSIASSAFEGGISLTSVLIPTNVLYINSWAFRNCSALKSVSILSEKTSISSSAFDGCNALTDVTVPGSKCDLNFSSVTNLTIVGTTTVGDGAFRDCTKLKNLTIAEGVTSVGAHAFDGCSELQCVRMPASLAVVGSDAFNGCDALQTILVTNLVSWFSTRFCTQESNPLSHARELIGAGEVVDLNNLVIPDGVVDIGENIMSGHEELLSVVIPESVRSIGECAFFRCSGLKNVVIPTCVTRIESSAFADCSALNSISIPTGVVQIANAVFSGCKALVDITIPTNITRIGSYAFSGCSGLTSLTIPFGVTDIGSYAFAGCTGLTTVTIPSSVVNVGSMAFYGCDGVSTAIVPGWKCQMSFASVTNLIISPGTDKIAANGFCDCKQLLSVFVTDGVQSIGEDAFHGCYSISTIRIPASVTNISNTSFNSAMLTDVTVPGWKCHLYFGNVTNLVISDGTTYIRDSENIREASFQNSEKLECVTIAASVTNIGVGAFSGCKSLREFAVASDSKYYSVTDGVLFSKDHSVLIKYPRRRSGEYVVPNDVLEIGKDAFRDCTDLVSVAFPAELKNIAAYAFSGCSSLKTLTIPTSVTNVGDYAFSKCTALDSVALSLDSDGLCWLTFTGCDGIRNIRILNGRYDLPVAPILCGVFADSYLSITNAVLEEGISNIPASEFYEFRGLRRLVLPESVTKIGDNAFRGCDNLTSVTFRAENSYFTSVEGVLFSQDMTQLIFCPRSFNGEYTVPDSVTTVCAGAFSGCGGLTKAILPNGLNTIGDCAFEGCEKLSCAEVPAGVMTIGERAFWDCADSMPIDIPSSVIHIGERAFGMYDNFDDGLIIVDGCVLKMKGNCPSSVVVPKGVRLIADGAFSSCATLLSITIPSSIRNIGSYAFYNCDALTSVTIPGEVKAVDKCAFFHCDALETVTFEDGVESIGSSAFGSCRKLTSLALASTITNIGAYAFSSTKLGTGLVIVDGCVLTVNDNITGEIILPKETRLISDGTFSYYCSGVTSINIIDNDYFCSVNGVLFNKECSELIAYPPGKTGGNTIPSSVTSIRPYIFRGCNIQETLTFEGAPPSGLQGAELQEYRPIYYNAQYEDLWRPIIKECGLRSANSYGSHCLIPDLGTDPSAEEISNVFVEAKAEDPKLAEKITNETEYVAFREWSGNVKPQGGSEPVGAAGVMAAPNAWLSYALGSEVLIEKAFTNGQMKVEAFAPSTNKSEVGKFDFTVSIEDVAIGSAATTEAQKEQVKENLKQVFGLEGGTSLEEGEMSSANVDITFGVPQDGKVKFTAGPKDADAPSFFMKVKLLP